MSFGQRLRDRRVALHLSRDELAVRLGVSRSAIGNYEISISFPKEEILLRLFDALQVDPNYFFQDSFQRSTPVLEQSELTLVEKYRVLAPAGQETLHSVANALVSYQDEVSQEKVEEGERQIPLYCSPAAAGYAAPVFGEDFDYIPVTPDVPQGAEFAVRIQGDSMVPFIADGDIIYVNRDPLASGDVGVFFLDGNMLCKQYHKDGGTVYLFSLNRKRRDADVVLTANSGQALVCFGRVMLHNLPLPDEA